MARLGGAPTEPHIEPHKIDLEGMPTLLGAL